MALSARNHVAPSKHGSPCSIAACYEHVANNPVELAELNTILYVEDNKQPQVYKLLTEHGDFPFEVGFQSINKHRGQKCRCWRERPFKFCFECKRDNASCVCDAA